jgi:hypothetical protein
MLLPIVQIIFRVAGANLICNASFEGFVIHRGITTIRRIYFLDRLADYERQQHHHRHADHDPEPHAAARPTAHPSVGIVHHNLTSQNADSPVVFQPGCWRVKFVIRTACLQP